MKEFLLGNYISILIFVVMLVIIAYLVVKGKWAELRALAFESMIKVENTIVGTKRGQERFEVVFKKLYNLIPPWLQFFVTESDLREQLQKWYNMIKDALDNGKIDGSAQPTSPPTRLVYENGKAIIK